jgi:hypothetical protein
MLSVVMLNVVMLNVVNLSVMAPNFGLNVNLKCFISVHIGHNVIKLFTSAVYECL